MRKACQSTRQKLDLWHRIISQSANAKEALQRKPKVNLQQILATQTENQCRQISQSLDAEGGEVAVEEEFKARFISDINIETKLAHKVIKAAAYHPVVLAQGHGGEWLSITTDDLIDEKASFQKIVPWRPSIAAEQKPGVVSGTNAAGDFLLFLCSEHPKTLKDTNSTLFVLHEWNMNAQLTAHLFSTWFTGYSEPTVETAQKEGGGKRSLSSGGPGAFSETDSETMRLQLFSAHKPNSCSAAYGSRRMFDF